MTNAELRAELEAFQRELEEHRRTWGDSLDETLPDLPQRNVEEIRQQCRSLSRRLGALQPDLRALRPTWMMGASGVTWDALEEAVRAEQTAAIKGPSLDAVIGALDQLIGQLARQSAGPEVRGGDQPINAAPPVPSAAAPERSRENLVRRYRTLGFFEKLGVWAAVASILGFGIAVLAIWPHRPASGAPVLVQSGTVQVKADVSNPTIDVYFPVPYESAPELTWVNMPYDFRVVEQRADGFKVTFSGAYRGTGPPKWQTRGVRRHK